MMEASSGPPSSAATCPTTTLILESTTLSTPAQPTMANSPPNPLLVLDSASRPAIAARVVGIAQRGQSSNSTQWSSVDLQILIGLKQQEFERALHDHPRERMRIADQRWANIEAGMRRANINRKAPLIRKKCEKLMTDFKKVFDYQQNIPSVLVGYYEMGSDLRKEYHLSPQFDHEAYNAMESWVPNHRAMFPRLGQISDSDDIQEEEGNTMGDTPPMTPIQAASENVPLVHTTVANPRQGTPPTPRILSAMTNSNTTIDSNSQPPSSSQGYKKRHDRVDENLKQMNRDFLETMVEESDK